MIIGIIIKIVVVLIAVYVIFRFVSYLISFYNSLVRSKMKIKEAWANIDAALKRRHDLIPNFVDTIKGYVAHEGETFTKIAKLRSKAMQSTGKEKMDTENEISGTLKSLYAVIENYPDLKANTQFIELQGELQRTENEISKLRTDYNGVVQNYNTKIAVFPQNLIASILGFKSEPLFEAKEEERENVKVSF